VEVGIRTGSSFVGLAAFAFPWALRLAGAVRCHKDSGGACHYRGTDSSPSHGGLGPVRPDTPCVPEAGF
jgi:hypothetical protein